jgi:transposase
VDTLDGAECAEEFTMVRRRNDKHSAAFREEAVRQAQTRPPEQSLRQLAADLGVRYSTLRYWVQEAGSPIEPPTQETEQNEVRRLRKEVRELRVEREILKKAMAFFAKHTR